MTVTVRLDGVEISVASRNISLKGLACTSDPLLQENACCQVVITLTPAIQAVIRGRVVRVGEDEAAIDFLAMDPESFVHLKKIVEYHSESPETVIHELLRPAFPISRVRIPFLIRNRK
jgi:hypothetical protein